MSDQTTKIIEWAIRLICAILAYGMAFAYQQHHSGDYFKDQFYYIDAIISCGCGVAVGYLGPLGLLVGYFCNDMARHGLKFK